MSNGIHRGEIVVVDFSPTQANSGIRPALIVQNDRDNGRMLNTIVAQITSNISRAHEDTQLLIDQNHPDWLASGLHRTSVVNCSSLGYVKKQHSESLEHCLRLP
jgi:mRNA-degrading endonuclease toxin of MazEF toxin-antitoxin module